MSTVASSFIGTDLDSIIGKDLDSIIGKGLDSITGKTKANSALLKLKQTTETVGKTFYTASFIQHDDQTANETALSTAVQAGTSIINFEGRAQFESLANKNKNELVYVMRFRKVDMHFKIKDDVSFSQEGQTQLVKKRDEFYRIYGDSYVSTVGYGKELRIVIKFKLDEKTDKKKYMSELNLKDASGTVSAGILYKLSTSATNKNINCEVELQASGGTIESPGKMTDLHALLNWIDVIGKQCLEGSFGSAKPVPLFLEKTSYTSVKCVAKTQSQGCLAETEEDAIENKTSAYDMAQYIELHINNILICKERASYLLEMLPQIEKNKENRSCLEKYHSRLKALANSTTQASSLSKKMKLIGDNKTGLEQIRIDLDRIKKACATQTYKPKNFIPRVSDSSTFKYKIASEQLKLFKEKAAEISVSEPFTLAYKNMGYFKRQTLLSIDGSAMALIDGPQPNTTLTDMSKLKGKKLFIITSDKAAAAKGASLKVNFREVSNLEDTLVEPITPTVKPG